MHNTAAAVKDEFGDGRWTLEAGALVLADKGLAAIDELDKMTEQDRSSMHEAMESQRVSVAKAGITASLQCRCSMLGAANPKFGRFDDTEALASQINMPPALLSRFDLIFALTDKPNAVKDLRIAEHILKGHVRGELRSVPNPEAIKGIDYQRIMEETNVLKPIFDREFMRKYVAFAKRYTPVLSDDARQLIIDKYLSIRKMGGEAGGFRSDHGKTAGSVHPSFRGLGAHTTVATGGEGGRRTGDQDRHVLPEQDGLGRGEHRRGQAHDRYDPKREEPHLAGQADNP